MSVNRTKEREEEAQDLKLWSFKQSSAPARYVGFEEQKNEYKKKFLVLDQNPTHSIVVQLQDTCMLF